MNPFSWIKQAISDYLSSEESSGGGRLLSLVVAILLLISISMTVHVVQLQQELRQRAAGSCRVENAECNVNQSDKSCCSGLRCSVKNVNNGNGKCELIPTPIPTTYTQPTSVPPSEGATPIPESGETPGLGGPAPVQCGPNGCGWSPRPEGENSNNAPGVQVCTMNFSGPTQLLGTRLSPTSIQFNWWPAPGGADRQFIQYGLEPGKPLWGLINIAGDQGQIVINDLPANKIIWAQVRAYKGNCYEDTGWLSVGPFNQTAYTTAVPQYTGVPTPPITILPTSISLDSASYFASTDDPSQYNFMQSIIEFFLFSLFVFFLFLILLRIIRFILIRKRKHKQREG